MQPCEDRIPALVDAASGELSAPQRAELNTHLLTCAACRAELEALQKTTSLLSSTARVPDDFSLSGFAVRTTDRAEAYRDRSVRGLWWSVTRGMRIAMSLSGAALAAAVTLLAVPERPRKVVETPVAAVPADDEADEAWQEYVPDAIELMHDGQSSFASSGLPSLDTGLDTLTDEELEALTDSLSQG